jgi:hypothetical protein
VAKRDNTVGMALRIVTYTGYPARPARDGHAGATQVDSQYSKYTLSDTTAVDSRPVTLHSSAVPAVRCVHASVESNRGRCDCNSLGPMGVMLMLMVFMAMGMAAQGGWLTD